MEWNSFVGLIVALLSAPIVSKFLLFIVNGGKFSESKIKNLSFMKEILDKDELIEHEFPILKEVYKRRVFEYFTGLDAGKEFRKWSSFFHMKCGIKINALKGVSNFFCFESDFFSYKVSSRKRFFNELSRFYFYSVAFFMVLSASISIYYRLIENELYLVYFFYTLYFIFIGGVSRLMDMDYLRAKKLSSILSESGDFIVKDETLGKGFRSKFEINRKYFLRSLPNVDSFDSDELVNNEIELAENEI